MNSIRIQIKKTEKIKAIINSLRIEEIIAILFFIPMGIISVMFFGAEEYPKGTLERFLITLAVGCFALIFFWKRPTHWLRDFLPFLLCIAIYTNLHDTVYFINPHDADPTLIKIDKFLLGNHLGLYLEPVISSWLTKWLSFNYSLYFIYPVTFGLILYFSKDKSKFRTFMLTVVLTFYIGYFIYLLVPAVGPKVYLKQYLTINLQTGQFEERLYNTFKIKASHRRDAFPSLHNAIALLVLLFSWKYQKYVFYIVLPFVLSLMFATVYLRHHYLIDVLAGWLLALIMFYYVPKNTKSKIIATEDAP